MNDETGQTGETGDPHGTAWTWMRNHFVSLLLWLDVAPTILRPWLLRRCGATIGPGTVLERHGSFVWGNLRLGREAYLSEGFVFQDFAEVSIGDRTWVGPGTMFLTRTHEVGGPQQRAATPVNRPIRIGNGCWLGAKVTILPGVTVGDGCIVGAGSVVTRDCEPHGMYLGAPARRHRELDQ